MAVGPTRSRDVPTNNYQRYCRLVTSMATISALRLRMPKLGNFHSIHQQARSRDAPANNYPRYCRLVACIIAAIAALFCLRMPNLGDFHSTRPHACSSKTSGRSSTAVNGKLIIDKGALRNQPKERLEQLKRFTALILADPGKEHYALLHYLTKTYHANTDCRHVVEIGTRYVASALALGASGVTVKAFNIPEREDHEGAFPEQTKEAWQQELQSTENVQIEFNNLNLLKASNLDFQQYMTTWLIVLDTYHETYSVQFERQFLARLVNLTDPFKFRGIILVDDIHYDAEMEHWWNELQDNAMRWGFVPHDLTSVGHDSGTGLLDFSGHVIVVDT
jgi:hypothetical protein